MLRRPLFWTPRLARQHFARNCYAVVSPHAFHVQWRRGISSNTSTNSTKAPRSGERYSAEEDKIILQMRALKHDWNSITSALPGRDMSSVQSHFYMVLNVPDAGRKHKRFTTEEIATIRDMLERGFYIHAIAKKIGRSYNSTRYYCRRIRAEQRPSRPTLDSNTTGTKHPIERKPWTRADIDRLLCLHASGLKPSAVARELGRSLQAVQDKYRQHVQHQFQASRFVAEGSGGDSAATLRPHARKHWSKENDEHFAELVANGADFERIASVFNRTVSAVEKRWRSTIRPRLNYERKYGISSHASSKEKQRQHAANNSSVPMKLHYATRP